jgi:hypothetical protein
MFALNSRLGQVSGKKTHFEGEENTLFAGHRPMNFELNIAGRVGGVGDGHG